MWRYGAMLLAVGALMVIGIGCKQGTEPAGTPTVEPPVPTPVDTATITYKCPMHETETSDSPGRCSVEGCDMFLVADVEPGQQVEYYCQMPDMHAEEQVSDEPGKCPKCGMFMKARLADVGDGDDDDDDEMGDDDEDDEDEDTDDDDEE